MADRYPESNDPAKRLAEDDRSLDSERLAEEAHVFDPRIQVPALRRTLVAPSLAAMIDEDQLRDVCERSQKRLERAVIETGTTMQADDDRPLAHDRPVRDEPHPGDVEVKPDVSHPDSHPTTLSSMANRRLPGLR